jgi:hypothetical protein
LNLTSENQNLKLNLSILRNENQPESITNDKQLESHFEILQHQIIEVILLKQLKSYLALKIDKYIKKEKNELVMIKTNQEVKQRLKKEQQQNITLTETLQVLIKNVNPSF